MNGWQEATGGRVAAVVTKGELHTFAGESCWRYDLAQRRPIEGPTPIGRAFPGVFPSQISAAFSDDYGRMCFFRGPDHLRYSPVDGRIENGLFRRGSGWYGAFVDGIDAALWCDPENVLMFKGDRYVYFDPETRRVRSGDPKPISACWPDFPFDRVDSVLQVGDEVVFVRGSQAVAYSGSTGLGLVSVNDLFPGAEPWASAARPPEPTPSVRGGHTHLGSCGRRRASVESRPLRRTHRPLL